MSDLIKKTKVVPFINTGTVTVPKWTQIKKTMEKSRIGQ